MAEFKENEHPRDKDGKFTDKGAGVKARLNTLLDKLNDKAPQEIKITNPTIYKKIDPKELRKPKDIKKLLGTEFKGYKGQTAIDKLLLEKQGHVKAAFTRPDIGDIDLIWGDDDCGLRHIIKERSKQGINLNEFLSGLTDVVEKGTYLGVNKKGRFEILYNNKMVIISPNMENEKITFLLTAYKTRYKK